MDHPKIRKTKDKDLEFRKKITLMSFLSEPTVIKSWRLHKMDKEKALM